MVLLAAGASRRMGRPKMLLPWGPTSIIGHLIGQWRTFETRQIGVVCAAGDQAIAAELDRLEFPMNDRLINPTPELGMFGSIQFAARWPGWKPGLACWAIVLGDQPHLKGETLSALLDFAKARRESICQPLWQGRRRHPVVLPATAFGRLGTTGDPDLKSFLESMPSDRAFCEISDPGLEIDIDHPADYERALALFAPP